jgi:hypothetical protein
VEVGNWTVGGSIFNFLIIYCRHIEKGWPAVCVVYYMVTTIVLIYTLQTVHKLYLLF